MAVSAVVFDFGYTLFDEDPRFTAVARDAGIPAPEFFAVLGAVIERRQDHRLVFEAFGIDPADAPPLDPTDFYDDAAPCVRSVRRQGRLVGIAGNTSTQIEGFLDGHVDVDFIESSEGWGVSKPDPEFFARVVDACGCPADEVLYVGDRIDKDIVPAAAAGMQTFWVTRGPWAAVHAGWPEASSVRASGSDLGSIVSGAL